jgi:hypothetical protein
MAQGMNWGIISLLGMIVAVLVTVGSFFFYLARRAASVSAVEPENFQRVGPKPLPPEPQPQTT